MRRLFLLGALGLAPVLLTQCRSEGCDIAGAASDGCGPPIYAYAHVQGHAEDAEGSPFVGKDAYVACGDAVGTYSDQTDDDGRFDIAPAYAVFDTLLQPFPPREADGSFFLDCRVSVAVSAEVVLLEDPVAVLFTPSNAPMVPTVVELKPAAP